MTVTSVTSAGTSARLPGSSPRRRTWPTPSVNSFFAGKRRNRSAPVCCPRTSQCLVIEKPGGTLRVVQSRYLAPAVAVSAVRMTTCPLNGSR